MGTRLVDGLIEQLGPQEGEDRPLLSPSGRLYFIAIKQNDPQDIVQRLRAKGLDADVALQRRAGREHLFVLRAVQPCIAATSS